MAELPPRSSASQLITYASCPRKFYYRYIAGLEPEHKSLSMIFGSAVHGAIGFFFEEKLAGRTPSISAAEQVFAADLAAQASEVDASIDELVAAEEEGRVLVALYLREHGELPVAHVERPFEVALVDPRTGELLPRAIKGYFDLVLDDGCIIELKTATRRWSAGEVQRHLQLGAYAHVAAQSRQGTVRLQVHVLVRRKRTPGVEVQEYAPRAWWLPAAIEIERAIQAGVFPPSPGPMCGGCEYAQACEAHTLTESGERTLLPQVAHCMP